MRASTRKHVVDRLSKEKSLLRNNLISCPLMLDFLLRRSSHTKVVVILIVSACHFNMAVSRLVAIATIERLLNTLKFYLTCFKHRLFAYRRSNMSVFCAF